MKKKAMIFLSIYLVMMVMCLALGFYTGLVFIRLAEKETSVSFTYSGGFAGRPTGLNGLHIDLARDEITLIKRKEALCTLPLQAEDDARVRQVLSDLPLIPMQLKAHPAHDAYQYDLQVGWRQYRYSDAQRVPDGLSQATHLFIELMEDYSCP